MFHSSGIVQSKTRVPEGTSCTLSGMDRCRICRVWRTPSPVRLRGIGNSSARSWYISWPASAKSDSAVTDIFLSLLVILMTADVEPVLDYGEADDHPILGQHFLDEVCHVEIGVLRNQVVDRGLEYIDPGVDQEAERRLFLQAGDADVLALDYSEGHFDFVLSYSHSQLSGVLVMILQHPFERRTRQNIPIQDQERSGGPTALPETSGGAQRMVFSRVTEPDAEGFAVAEMLDYVLREVMSGQVHLPD